MRKISCKLAFALVVTPLGLISCEEKTESPPVVQNHAMSQARPPDAPQTPKIKPIAAEKLHDLEYDSQSSELVPFPVYPRGNPEEDFYQVGPEGTILTAKPSTLVALEPYLAEIQKAASQNIIFIEPSKIDAEDIDNITDLLAESGAFPPPKTVGPVRGKNGLAKFNRSMNAQFDSMHRMELMTFAMVMIAQAENFADGKNYAARRIGAGRKESCIIMGDLDVEGQKIAQMLGDISQRMATPEFAELFSDTTSIMMITLLHEAYHCSQKGKVSFSEDSEGVLKYEIDADRSAIAHYRELVAAGIPLDPDMPEKLRQLRVLAPILRSRGNAMSSLSSIMQDHATAAGLDLEEGAEINSSSILKNSVRETMIIKAIIYELAAPEARERLMPLAQMDVEGKMLSFRIALNGAFEKETSLERRKVYGQLIEFMPQLMDTWIKLTIADMVQKEDYMLAYNALVILTERGWKAAGPEEDFVQKKAEDALEAWKALNLPLSEAGAVKREIPSLAPGKPLSQENLSIMLKTADLNPN